MKIKIIKQVNAVIDGEHRKFEIGDVVEARSDEADNLIRGKYAEEVRSKPATKVVRTPEKAQENKRTVK